MTRVIPTPSPQWGAFRPDDLPLEAAAALVQLLDPQNPRPKWLSAAQVTSPSADVLRVVIQNFSFQFRKVEDVFRLVVGQADGNEILLMSSSTHGGVARYQPMQEGATPTEHRYYRALLAPSGHFVLETSSSVAMLFKDGVFDGYLCDSERIGVDESVRSENVLAAQARKDFFETTQRGGRGRSESSAVTSRGNDASAWDLGTGPVWKRYAEGNEPLSVQGDRLHVVLPGGGAWPIHVTKNELGWRNVDSGQVRIADEWWVDPKQQQLGRTTIRGVAVEMVRDMLPRELVAHAPERVSLLVPRWVSSTTGEICVENHQVSLARCTDEPHQAVAKRLTTDPEAVLAAAQDAGLEVALVDVVCAAREEFGAAFLEALAAQAPAFAGRSLILGLPVSAHARWAGANQADWRFDEESTAALALRALEVVAEAGPSAITLVLRGQGEVWPIAERIAQSGR